MKVPSYRKHSTRDKAFVVRDKKRVYLPGKHGSPESLRAYRAIIKELSGTIAFENNVAMVKQIEAGQKSLTILDLMALFLNHAKEYYPSDGNCEYSNLRCSVKLFDADHGDDLIINFTAQKFLAWQRKLAKQKLRRTYINSTLNRIKRVFRWGIVEGHVPEIVYAAISAVAPLKRGRSSAVEPTKRKPVSRQDFDDVRHEVKPIIAVMMEIQWITGVRSDSLVHATPAQFTADDTPSDTAESGLVLWRPKHKTEYRGVDLVLPVGKKVQALFAPYISKCKSQEEYIFCPRREINNSRYNDKYTTKTYQDAIERAVKRINKRRHKARENGKSDVKDMLHWTPHQIRHARGHEVRNKFGIEAAQAVLGHESLSSAEIYSSKRLELARDIARKTG